MSLFQEQISWLRNISAQNGIELTEIQLEQLEYYAHLLLDWNKKINLISRKGEETIWTYHIVHCISLLFKIDIMKGCKIVDIGTGGGLPGIPIKIVRPDLSILCIDSTGKKAKAVDQMINDLKLDQIQAVWGESGGDWNAVGACTEI